jgi:hypothetical protein
MEGRFLLFVYNWVTLPFWSDRLITSCGGRVIKEEHYKI